jgi:site-specific DNA-methyltransferase (adenine-specific)/modification methylase
MNTTHKITLGDCIKGMSKLDAETVAVVFADPPYNLSNKPKIVNRKSVTGGDFYKVAEQWDKFTSDEYSTFTTAWLSEAWRILKSNGALYVCASQHNLAQVLASVELLGFQVKNIIIWEKPNAMPNMTRRTLTHSIEFVVWAVKGKNWIFNYESLRELNPETQKDGSPKMMRDVWRFPVVQGEERLRLPNGRALHPTQKPEALVKRCLVASTKPGDLVVDPFMGSGTTAAVAAEIGRNSLGFDMEEHYVKAAKLRVKAKLRKFGTVNAQK